MRAVTCDSPMLHSLDACGCPRPFRVVVADPAWRFDDKLPGPGRGAEKHYATMSVDEICRLVLPPLHDDCHLFLWRVAAMVEEAYDVARAWGFTPKSEIVWRKLTVNGKRWFGMGNHVRMEHETAIIATRGRPKVVDRTTRSVFDADEPSLFSAPAGEHSAKPDEFYAIVERLCAGPRVELFARRERPGWTCLGDQVPNNPTTLVVAPP